MKEEIQIRESIKEVKFLLKVIRIKPKIRKMTNETEKEEIQSAIKEIRFLIQVLQDVPISNPISRDIQKRFISGMKKEEQDYAEYLNSTFYTDEEQKAIDNLIDCEIEEMKIKREEKNL